MTTSGTIPRRTERQPSLFPSALLQSARRQALRYLPADPRLRRARAATVAHVMNMGAALAVRAVSVPLALKMLGVERYGIWLTLLTLLSWLVLVDLGAPTALINPLIAALARDDRAAARRLVSSTLAFLVPLAGVVLAVVAAAVAFLPIVRWMGVRPELAGEARAALLVALAFIALMIPLRLWSAILRAQQREYLVPWPEVAGQLLFLGGLVVMWRTGATLTGFVLALQGMFALAHAVMFSWVFLRHAPDLRPAPSFVRFRELRSVSGEGFAFFLGILGNLVVTQTAFLIISHFVGPAAVPAYGVPYQLYSFGFGVVFSWVKPLWPAYADAASRGDVDWIVRHHRRSLWQCVGAMAAGSMVIVLVGGPFIRWWTLGHVETPAALLLFMSLYFPLWMWSWVNGNLLQALGGIGQRSAVMLVNAALNLVLCIALVQRFGPVGVTAGSVVALACTEVIAVPLLVRRKLRRLHDEVAAGAAAVEPAGDEAPSPAVPAT